MHGFRRATIDEIAARVSISKPNLLYYFAHKDDVYATVLENIVAD